METYNAIKDRVLKLLSLKAGMQSSTCHKLTNIQHNTLGDHTQYILNAITQLYPLLTRAEFDWYLATPDSPYGPAVYALWAERPNSGGGIASSAQKGPSPQTQEPKHPEEHQHRHQ